MIGNRPRSGVTLPILVRGTVCALSTMTCDGLSNPFADDGSTSNLISGAVRKSLVIGKMVTDECASKKSD